MMSELNPSQKGFVVRLLILGGLFAGGLILQLIVKVGGSHGLSGMNVSAWVGMIGVLALMVASLVISILTLRYGKRHETEIRKRSGLAIALTIYRILFWLWVAFVVLGAIFFGGLAVLFTHPVG
ncbi:MAG: hypothetical protein COC22_01060 [Flavobacteriaceae bacterium]|nr:MAG: hypothetical protein COC22_01060 [Flavobacteriaceae bacterium]